MSRLTLQTWTMPAANFGGENPLAPLRPCGTASAVGAASADGEHPDRGSEHSVLPYRLQDGYDRALQPRAFKTAVLENQHLRATFLLELGGRLWSLVHKPTGRELLFVNPVFQPANLAVRDAWFSGGVEWNVSIVGHSPFTCAPLFAARVSGDDGSPVLRLYEWDRIRRVPFQIDCWLPDGVPFLMVRVKITNPNDHTVPMYWWSNIAVPERKDVRVLAPAERAYRHDYDGRLVEHDVPIYSDVDVTYTTNRQSAADLYFRIPSQERPWIAALGGDGHGLVHTSTDRLRGRKMFNWGVATGGRRWQEFLAKSGKAYLEIQGGLARTQSEYLAMPASAEWSWLEAYGLLEADRAAVHGNNWPTAHGAAGDALERALPRRWMDAELRRSAATAEREPIELLHHGSGWGALERRRRTAAEQGPFASAALPFPDASLGDEQAAWIALLERGEVPRRSTAQDPGSLMVQPEWRAMLEHSASGAGGHWLAWYHLGVMRFRAGDHDGAEAAWKRSLELEASAWAYRDLAVLARERGQQRNAAELWMRASRLAPDLAPLTVECCQALLGAGMLDELLEYIAALPPKVRSHGRVRLLAATAALERGDLDTVGTYFESELDIANIREKETNLSDLWFRYHERRLAAEAGVAVDDALRQRVRREFPPPMRFDFRLKSE